MTPEVLLAEAERIADEVLFPAALAVDAQVRIPPSHLDLLAAGGWYGLVGPPELSPLPPHTYAESAHAVELLAGGCLSTAFVWLQHHSAVTAVANSPFDAVREHWLPRLCSGERRAGLAVGAAVRPGPPSLRAVATADGYVFDGDADWVTGWGLVDVLHVAARDENDTLVWALLDARPDERLQVEPLDLVAVMASRTVRLRLDRYPVPAARVTGTLPYAQWPARDAASLRFNGSLALGVAGRSLRLAGEPTAAVDAVRAALDRASTAEMPHQRAQSAYLALRSAALATVAGGSRSVLIDQHAQRLLREATFLLVFGSRPAIKAELLALLHG
jgi:alkylation response protein AidB-like acyl-CoA dehydrogenase